MKQKFKLFWHENWTIKTWLGKLNIFILQWLFMRLKCDYIWSFQKHRIYHKNYRLILFPLPLTGFDNTNNCKFLLRFKTK
jgi:hypothetical protein